MSVDGWTEQAGVLRLREQLTELNELFDEEGYENTHIVTDDEGGYVTKRTTTNDLARLLRPLDAGTLLSDCLRRA